MTGSHWQGLKLKWSLNGPVRLGGHLDALEAACARCSYTVREIKVARVEGVAPNMRHS